MAKSTCTVGNCDRQIKNKALGYCDPHYKRYWRTGDVQAHIPLAPPRRTPEPVRDFPDGTRECQDCQQRLPLDAFHNDAKAPGGKRKECKACRIERETERYNRDPERHRQRMLAYRQANLDKVRAADTARYERDKEKRLVLAIANSHIRRARMANNGFERGVTVPALRKIHGDSCHYCGVTMVFKSFPKGKRPSTQATLEHLQAISRGGSHTFDNCRLSCWGCNSSKGTSEYPSRLMLIA